MTARRRLHPLFPLVLALIFLLPAPAHPQGRMVVVLRVDDVLSRNTAILPRSIDPFEQAAAARGAKVTWVVIPHRLIESTNTDGSLTRQLRATAARGHEISQHGYNHICTRCGSTGHEMWCATNRTPFTAAEQRATLRSGLTVLADSLAVVPRSFVSPGHSEDTATYRLLRDEGFDAISTPHIPTRSFAHPGLFNVAHHREYTWAMTPAVYAERRDSALHHVAVEGERDGYFCFLFHDPFIRSGYENGVVVRWVGEVLDSLVARYGQRLEFLTLSGAADRLRGSSSVAAAAVGHPATVDLLQNYPNPFNGETIIRYRVDPERDAVVQLRLAVHDLTGRLVRVLAEGAMGSGEHAVSWDGRTADGTPAASGVYLYRLELRGGGRAAVRTKELLLLR
jgi:predicted deacetylase